MYWTFGFLVRPLVRAIICRFISKTQIYNTTHLFRGDQYIKRSHILFFFIDRVTTAIDEEMRSQRLDARDGRVMDNGSFGRVNYGR